MTTLSKLPDAETCEVVSPCMIGTAPCCKTQCTRTCATSGIKFEIFTATLNVTGAEPRIIVSPGPRDCPLAPVRAGPSLKVLHRPRLLSDNGPSYVSSALGQWHEDNGMAHTRGRPYHPMTQGKIERYHRSLKNCILPENYYLPGDLKHSIAGFVDYDNTRRYHES